MPISVSKVKPFEILDIIQFVKTNWWWLTFLIFIIPATIHAFTTAENTDNPSYPLMLVAEQLLASDTVLHDNINLLEEGKVEQIVGMQKPTAGIWNSVKWYWLWFWYVPFALTGLIYTIFFPAILFYKIMVLIDNTSVAKNTLKTGIFFLIFLFVTNTTILVYNISEGNKKMDLPQDTEKFGKYWYILKNMLPFHGIVAFGVYCFHLITGKIPFMYTTNSTLIPQPTTSLQNTSL